MIISLLWIMTVDDDVTNKMVNNKLKCGGQHGKQEFFVCN